MGISHSVRISMKYFTHLLCPESTYISHPASVLQDLLPHHTMSLTQLLSLVCDSQRDCLEWEGSYSRLLSTKTQIKGAYSTLL